MNIKDTQGSGGFDHPDYLFLAYSYHCSPDGVWDPTIQGYGTPVYWTEHSFAEAVKTVFESGEYTVEIKTIFSEWYKQWKIAHSVDHATEGLIPVKVEAVEEMEPSIADRIRSGVKLASSGVNAPPPPPPPGAGIAWLTRGSSSLVEDVSPQPTTPVQSLSSSPAADTHIILCPSPLPSDRI